MAAEQAHPELAWTRADLPPRLRNLSDTGSKVGKAIYNARLLAGMGGDPVAETLADLKRRRIA